MQLYSNQMQLNVIDKAYVSDVIYFSDTRARTHARSEWSLYIPYFN